MKKRRNKIVIAFIIYIIAIITSHISSLPTIWISRAIFIISYLIVRIEYSKKSF